MASSDAQSSHDSPREPETSCRGKTDIAWKYAREEKDPVTKKRSITCLVCLKKIMGGGINRLKKHLAGQRGEIAPCKRVSPDVRYQMLESLKETSTKKRQREVEADDDQDNDVQEIEEVQMNMQTSVPITTNRNGGNFDAIDLTEDLVVDDDPDPLMIVEMFAGEWNELDDNDDMEMENDRMFERHDLNDVGYQDVGSSASHINLNDFPH
ncbi:hypothetical protein MKW92_014023 [Papaver armeniacum]|nr:hypothetical protein MKW92_014023 [Papaver armeniacum]